MLPLLGAIGGILGLQSAYDERVARQDAERAERVRGIMGTAPVVENLPAGIEGPPELRQAGTGLLADPFNPALQAQAAARLMERGDTAQIGAGMFGNAVSGVQRGQEFQQSLAFDQQKLQRQIEQWDRDHETRVQQWQERFNLDKQNAERIARYEEARLGLEQRRVALSERGGEGTGAGKPQAGYTRYLTEGGQTMDLPSPGTKEYREAQGDVKRLAEAQSATRAMRDYVREYGTFDVMGGRERGAALEVQRDKVISAMAVLNNMGVLQPGELDRLQSIIPKIGGAGGTLTMSNASALKVLESLGERFDAAVQGRLEQMPNLPRAEVLPPGWVSESDYRKQLKGGR